MSEATLFPFLKTRSTRAASRLFLSDARKVLRSSAKITKAALRQGAGIMRDTRGALNVQAAGSAVRPPGRFVEVDGIRVHYIVRGRGRPVVLIHGNGTMAQDFDVCGLVDELASRYRVIAIDRPGFGQTKRMRHCIWTPAAQARLIDSVMCRLSVERPIILGHSWGTLVALSLAARNANDLRGLVLLSGYFFPANRAAVALSAPLAVPGLGDAARAMITRPMHQLFAHQGFRTVFSPQPVPSRFKAKFPAEIATSRDQLRASAEDTAIMNAAVAQLRPYYQKLQVPVAILAGDADAVVDTAAQSARLHAEMPGSSFKLLPGKGHMIHYSNRRDVARAVDEIMDTTQIRARKTIRL